MLKAAFVQGRLAKDEFLDLRVGRVLTSRTYADLAALTADVPSRVASAELSDEPAGEALPDAQLQDGSTRWRSRRWPEHGLRRGGAGAG